MTEAEVFTFQRVGLGSIIPAAALRLQPLMRWGNARALLCAIADVESSFSINNLQRFEKSFDYGGKYANAEQVERLKVWGRWAASSYGSFQMMYPTACSLGFDRAPWTRNPLRLFDDREGIIYVTELISKRILAKGATSIREIADAYNSGSFKDEHVPLDYVAKLCAAYDVRRKEQPLV